mgnify:CR=1 FL=1
MSSDNVDHSVDSGRNGDGVGVWKILSIALPSLGVLAATPIYLLFDCLLYTSDAADE